MTEPRVVATINVADLPTLRPGLDYVDSDTMTAMLQAVIGEHSFESSGAPDTPINRQTFASLQDDHRALPEGQMLDIPQF